MMKKTAGFIALVALAAGICIAARAHAAPTEKIEPPNTELLCLLKE